jgi:hypothetical protein
MRRILMKKFIILAMNTLLLFLFSNISFAIPLTNWHEPYGSVLEDLTDEDDEYQRVRLSNPVLFYGTSYSRIYVNTNGSLTFTDRTDDYDVGSDFEDEYGPSIAAFWSDLDLSENEDARVFMTNSTIDGSIAYIFTWFEVPDYEDDDLLNTFQAIITEDGHVQLNFLHLDGVDMDEDPDEGVVGITDGTGDVFDYQTMDTWTFPRSRFSIGFEWDGEAYTRSEWDWDEVPASAPVPEPSTMFLFGIGLLGMAGLARKKR